MLKFKQVLQLQESSTFLNSTHGCHLDSPPHLVSEVTKKF